MVKKIAHRNPNVTEQPAPKDGAPDKVTDAAKSASPASGAASPAAGSASPAAGSAPPAAGAAADCEACSRRSFLYLTTTAAGVAGVGAAAWPFLDQMNPSASVVADTTREINISAIPAGQQQVFSWRGHPLVVRHRTDKEIAAARAVKLTDLLDQKARNANLDADAPATDDNRVFKAAWLVLIGVCTHLGCSPAPSTPAAPLGHYGGWLCECHGSQFDTSGRVRTGPAAQNLFIPRYVFVSDTVIRVG